MSRPRPQTRSGKPIQRRPGGWRAGWDALRARAALPGPGRLAMLATLAAVTIASLVLLATVSAGGLNRFGLQRLAADIPVKTPPPAKSGYISR